MEVWPWCSGLWTTPIPNWREWSRLSGYIIHFHVVALGATPKCIGILLIIQITVVVLLDRCSGMCAIFSELILGQQFACRYSSIYETMRKNKGKIWTIALYKFIYQCLLSHNKKKGKENICKVQRRSSTIATKNNSHFACLEHYIHTSDEVLISIREACVYNVYAAAVLPFFHASQVV